MADIKFEISDAQIQNAIAVALADSFSEEKKSQLIKDVVRAHLTAKPDTYSRETILSKSVGDMVRQQANKALAESVDELAPKIKAEIKKYLGKQFQESLFEQFKNAVSNIKIGGFTITAEYESE